MGTRGAVGFIIKGEEKITYNHFDSYPDGLGNATLAFLREFLAENSIEELRREASAIRIVSDERRATPEEIARLRPVSNFAVGGYPVSGPPNGELPAEDVDWYNLLRGTQGDWAKILEVGLMEDGHLFPLDSLFCEWAYLINLDDEALEVYRGFQEELPKKGRWAGRPTAEEDARVHAEHLQWCSENNREPWMPLVSAYKAVELVATFPLGDLPSDEEFVAQLELEEEE